MLGNRQVAYRDVTVMNSNWLVGFPLVSISRDIYKHSKFSVDFGCFVDWIFRSGLDFVTVIWMLFALICEEQGCAEEIF